MNKTLLALVIAALLIPATSFAAHGEHGGPGKYMDRTAAALQLSDEQREQFQSIMKEQRQKHRVIHQETQSRLDAILNDEQRAQLETMRSERKQRWQERRQKYKDRHSDRS